MELKIGSIYYDSRPAFQDLNVVRRRVQGGYRTAVISGKHKDQYYDVPDRTVAEDPDRFVEVGTDIKDLTELEKIVYGVE